MPGFGDILQKAVYLGVGLASYAGEKAGSKLTELRTEAQKLADELVKRGEMSTEEARRFVDDMVQQAQQQPPVESAGNKNRLNLGGLKLFRRKKRFRPKMLKRSVA